MSAACRPSMGDYHRSQLALEVYSFPSFQATALRENYKPGERHALNNGIRVRFRVDRQAEVLEPHLHGLFPAAESRFERPEGRSLLVFPQRPEGQSPEYQRLQAWEPHDPISEEVVPVVRAVPAAIGTPHAPVG